MNVLKEDLRFVIWTGKKFLFFGRKDFRRPMSVARDLRNVSMYIGKKSFVGPKLGEDVSEYVKIFPVNFTCDLSIDGSGSASLTFEAPEGKFDYRLVQKRPPSKYRDKILDDFILPYVNGYYKDYNQFSTKYIKEFDAVSDPIFLFSAPQIIWVDITRNFDDPDGWYRVFTGVIDQTSETENTGKSKTINLKASNLLQCITKIPLIHQLQIVPFGDAILPDDALFQSFWKVYMMTMFSRDANSRFIGWDTTAEMKLSDLFGNFVRRVNFSVGAVTNQDPFDLQAMLPEINGTISAYQLTPEDVWNWFEIIRLECFYRFKIFDENVDLYKGEENKVNVEVGFEDLFQTLYPLSIGKLKFNKIIMDLEAADLTKKTSVFKKLMKITYNNYKPTYAMISNLVRRISTGYGMMSHTDGFGNWIVEYPNFNALPRIGSEEVVTELANLFVTPINPPENLDDAGLEAFWKDRVNKIQMVATPPLPPGKFSPEDIAYLDCDRRYVFQKFDATSWTHSVNPDKYVTFLELPFTIDFPPGMGNVEHIQKFFIGRDYAAIKEYLQFGLNEVHLDSLYFSIGSLSVDHEAFLASLSNMFRTRLNAEVFSCSVNMKVRPELQLGRNIVVVHKEKKYLIGTVKHSFDSGRGAITSLGLTHGRSLHVMIPNPWQYFVNYVDDIQESTLAEVETYQEIVGTGVVIQNDQEIAKAVKDACGYQIQDPQVERVIRESLGVYRRLAPGPRAVEAITEATSQKQACKSLLTVDTRLIQTIDILFQKLYEWIPTKFPGMVGRPFLYICSAWRENTPGNDSRHGFGRAIDISCVTVKMNDPSGEVSHDYHFNYMKDPVKDPERFIPDKIFAWLGELKYQQNNPDNTKNCCLWHHYAEAKASPKGADHWHDIHIHFSVADPTGKGS